MELKMTTYKDKIFTANSEFYEAILSTNLPVPMNKKKQQQWQDLKNHCFVILHKYLESEHFSSLLLEDKTYHITYEFKKSTSD